MVCVRVSYSCARASRLKRINCNRAAELTESGVGATAQKAPVQSHHSLLPICTIKVSNKIAVDCG